MAARRAVAGYEQSVGLLRELLPSGRLPGNSVETIEAKQAEFAAQPKISIGRLGYRENGAHGKPVPGSPSRVPVLAYLQGWVERENEMGPDQQRNRANRN